MKLKYTTDICGNDLLTDDSENHQIMMEWEKPYMEYSINMLKPFGRVLEIGFGMGYSATKICEFNAVTEYNVVECSPVVWKKFELWRNEILKKRPELKIEIIKGRWEDVLCKESNGSYDSIYFDDYNGELVESISRFPRFFYKIIKDHIKIGSKICSYCTKNHNSFDITNAHYECFEYNIDIPQYCKYAKGDKMYVPIWTIVGIISVEEQEKILQPTNSEQEKFKKQALKAKEYYDKPKSIYCNLLVIDNFYIDAKETREYILKEEFKVRGNYPGQRTTSKANIHLKEMIQGYIQHFAGKIIDWPMPSTNNNNGQNNNDTYNGAFQYTTSRDRTWIHNDGWNNWAGVLYLTPNAPVSSGTGIFRFKDGTRSADEAEVRGNKKLLDENSQDYTKWELVDRVGNVFNRLVLFNSKQYHASLDYFGTNKENGRLFQVFFFSTER
tara:strand:+ start:1605 stop:2927 length:1323 start_codon:yes stop_codon:yes gene_type:complete